MPDVVIVGESEVRDWFRGQLSRRDSGGRKVALRALAEELGVNKSTVSRNGRQLRNDQPLAAPFYALAAARLAAERLDVLRVRHLRLLEESREDARREEARRAEEACVARAERARDRNRRLSMTDHALETVSRLEAVRYQRLAAARAALEPWFETLRAAGIRAPGDETLYGDALELIEAGITDIYYADAGVAAVALVADGYVFECGLTAAELRSGLTAEQRLQPTAVADGQDLPGMIGAAPSLTVRRVSLPDETWRYGEDDAAMMNEWRRLTEACADLATGELPWFVSRSEFRDFGRLVRLESKSAYTFEDSVLGEDAERRLRQMKRRATLSSVMTGAMELAAGGLRWCLLRGWRYAAYIALAVMLAIALFLLAWGVWELLKFLWELLVDHRWQILGVLAAIAATAGAIWWIWPKTDRSVYPPRRDAALKVVARFGIVACIVFMLVWIAVVFVQLMHFMEAAAPYVTGISEGVNFP